MSILGRLQTSWQSLFRPGRSYTVRSAFSISFVALLLGAAAINSTEQSYVRIAPSTTKIDAGEQFWIDVYAFAHEPVNAVNISLSFPEDKVEILGVDIGQSVITIWTEDPYVDGNKVIMSGGTFQNGFKGEHLIATVNARARNTGLAQFSAGDIKLLAGDGQGTPVSVGSSGTEDINLFVVDESTDVRTIAAEVGLEILTDVDGDGEVGIRDLSVFMSAWLDGSSMFDFNGDGRMTFRDFSIILSDSFFR
ncbi:MAG: dockerin type I domain-containing protein [Patescibacteria group bacterium]